MFWGVFAADLGELSAEGVWWSKRCQYWVLHRSERRQFCRDLGFSRWRRGGGDSGSEQGEGGAGAYSGVLRSCRRIDLQKRKTRMESFTRGGEIAGSTAGFSHR
ncbi:hypothetical protein U1Q18_017044 [Sarracenia purpurea var. burkii]